MQLKKNFLSIILFSTFTMAGCGNEPKTTENENNVETNQQTEQNIETDLNNPPVQTEEETHKKPAENESGQISFVPLDQYQNINRQKDLNWLTALFLAQTTREISDEEKINLMYPEYYNEKDGFKKKDLQSKLMPQMKSELSKYNGDYRVKVPINVKEEKEQALKEGTEYDAYISISDRYFYLERYDFDKQSFNLQKCGFYAVYPLIHDVSNKQGVKMISTEFEEDFESKYAQEITEKSCSIKVTNENLARKIEAAINSKNLKTIGFVYFKINANFNKLLAQPIYAKITYLEKDSGEELITKEFNWK